MLVVSPVMKKKMSLHEAGVRCLAFFLTWSRSHRDVSCISDIETVYNWLKFFKMEEYAENFEKDGFDTLRGVATINEDDLIDMDVKKGHRRVVLSHIEELRNQLAMLDENAQVAGTEPLSSPTLSMLPPITKTPSMSSLASVAGVLAAGGEAVPHRTERRGSITAPSLTADV